MRSKGPETAPSTAKRKKPAPVENPTEKAGAGQASHLPQRTRRDRLQPEDRERMILNNAAHFFATNGYSAPLRDLARNINVSPSLILRYFGTKTELVRRVYEEVVWKRWNVEWNSVLHDRHIPIRERLKAFYRWFMEIADDYEYFRCGIYSGLEGAEVGNMHFQAIVEKYLKLIAIELRAENGDLSTRPVGLLELERVWVLHGAFVNFLTRKHVHRRSSLPERVRMIETVIDIYLDGAVSRGNGSQTTEEETKKPARSPRGATRAAALRVPVLRRSERASIG